MMLAENSAEHARHVGTERGLRLVDIVVLVEQDSKWNTRRLT